MEPATTNAIPIRITLAKNGDGFKVMLEGTDFIGSLDFDSDDRGHKCGTFAYNPSTGTPEWFERTIDAITYLLAQRVLVTFQ